jgi:hypothetical protein
MRLRYWFLVTVFLVGLVLISMGLYYVLVVGDSQLGFELLMVGGIVWAVLMAVGMLYVARIRYRILRDASHF